ncbi:hypothetical protein HNY73_000718 [Argiope bruennichi]|uniref:Uncharacterized protein n=1 Tax=Argiope bruennichi TaxID=94029 RepID=A0A8T0FZ01_ARGBR|nr:hypothetical protein HNY73_000718 [Argiope bruennichi]
MKTFAVSRRFSSLFLDSIYFASHPPRPRKNQSLVDDIGSRESETNSISTKGRPYGREMWFRKATPPIPEAQVQLVGRVTHKTPTLDYLNNSWCVQAAEHPINISTPQED